MSSVTGQMFLHLSHAVENTRRTTIGRLNQSVCRLHCMVPVFDIFSLHLVEVNYIRYTPDLRLAYVFTK